ncbi:LPXTG cell wall anchor domain-containing protein [Parolsenella catena]
MLAQTGVGDQAWWLIVGGCAIICLAVAALTFARRRHG